MGLAYSTVRDWLVRMHAGNLGRRFDRRRTGKKRMLAGATLTYNKRWLNGNPQRYEFEAGSWQTNMVLEMVRKRFKISCRVRALKRVLGRLGFSYRKPRPISDKSASEAEQEEFKQETAGLLEEMSKQGHVVRVCRNPPSIFGLFWTLPPPFQPAPLDPEPFPPTCANYGVPLSRQAGDWCAICRRMANYWSMDSLGKCRSMAGWHGFWCKISTLGKLRLLEILLSQIKYDTVRCRSMLNGTDIVSFVDKIEWQTAFSTFVNGAIAIGLVTVLIALAIGAIYLISRIAKFPISDMFALARDLAKDRINQYKASGIIYLSKRGISRKFSKNPPYMSTAYSRHTVVRFRNRSHGFEYCAKSIRNRRVA